MSSSATTMRAMSSPSPRPDGLVAAAGGRLLLLGQELDVVLRLAQLVEHGGDGRDGLPRHPAAQGGDDAGLLLAGEQCLLRGCPRRRCRRPGTCAPRPARDAAAAPCWRCRRTPRRSPRRWPTRSRRRRWRRWSAIRRPRRCGRRRRAAWAGVRRRHRRRRRACDRSRVPRRCRRAPGWSRSRAGPTTSCPSSTSRLARSIASSASIVWSLAGRSKVEAMTSPLTPRWKSVTSSGRASSSTTMRWASGLLREIDCATDWRIVVRPDFGGATIRPRWPLPIGAAMSMTRPVRLAASVSRRKPLGRVDRREGLELEALAGGLGVGAVDAVDAHHRVELLLALALAGLAHLADDRVAATQTELPHHRQRQVDVVGAREVARGADEGVVVEDVEDAGRRDEDVVLEHRGVGLVATTRHPGGLALAVATAAAAVATAAALAVVVEVVELLLVTLLLWPLLVAPAAGRLLVRLLLVAVLALLALLLLDRLLGPVPTCSVGPLVGRLPCLCWAPASRPACSAFRSACVGRRVLLGRLLVALLAGPAGWAAGRGSAGARSPRPWAVGRRLGPRRSSSALS